tara:strand:+ start:425 stop:904 length:480 start_codon:yes stop_codon:yes gene_type:complete
MDDDRTLTWFERKGYGSRRTEVNLVAVLFLIFAGIILFLPGQLDLSFSLSDSGLGLEGLTNAQGALALIALFCFFFSSLIVYISSIYSTGIFSGRNPTSFILFLLLLIFPIGWIYAYYWWTFSYRPKEEEESTWIDVSSLIISLALTSLLLVIFFDVVF